MGLFKPLWASSKEEILSKILSWIKDCYGEEKASVVEAILNDK